MIKLRFIGSGDAFGSGGRFNTCFHVQAGNLTFLIDCGASSLIAMRQQGVDPAAIDLILITHLHGDHFGGLPFFLLEAQFVSRRDRPLVIAGPAGLKKRLATLREALFPGSSRLDLRFGLDIRELRPSVLQAVEGLDVLPLTVSHPSGAPSFALRVEAEGKVLAYSGDTEWTEALTRAAHGADLFITETYGFRMAVPYHLDLTTVHRHLPRMKAKRVILTHLGPEMLDNTDQTGLEIAHDGLVVEV